MKRMDHTGRRRCVMCCAVLVGALLGGGSLFVFGLVRAYLPEPVVKVLHWILVMPLRPVVLIWGDGDNISPWFAVAVIVLFWAAAGACIAASLVSLCHRRRARFAQNDEHCEECGYCLRGLRSGRCPECGRAFSR